MLDAAHAHPQPVEDQPDPLGIALGEVVVDRDDVDATAGQAVEVCGQRGHERLPLAGLHLRDLSTVQDHTAQHLDVVVALAERTTHGLPDRGKGIG